MVCIIDQGTLSTFHPGADPMAAFDTSIWDGHIQQDTQVLLEQAVDFADHSVQAGFRKGQHEALATGSETKLVAAQDTSTLSFVLCTRDPPQILYEAGKAFLPLAEWHDRVQQWITDNSVRFHPKFWAGLDQWAARTGIEPLCVIFLRVAFPAHFSQISAAAASLRAQISLEASALGSAMAAKIDIADQEHMAAMQDAMQQLAEGWFPVLQGKLGPQTQLGSVADVKQRLLQIQAEIQCPSCKQNFTWRYSKNTPRLLPCAMGSHACCEDCLNSMASISGGLLRCPTCR